MTGFGSSSPDHPPRLEAVQAYLLGTLDFAAAEAFQRRLVYEVAGDPSAAAVILCDHPPGVTIGREGSRAHVRVSPQELALRGWPVRWVARGGGALLHAPGQVACYPVFPLGPLGLTPAGYVRELTHLLADLVAGFGLGAEVGDGSAVRVHGRRIGQVGVAVRNWVTSFGLVVNVAPDLAPFRDVDCDGDPVRMTSLQRESPSPVRPTAVRQRLLDLLAERFGVGRLSVFHNHPTFLPNPPRHAIPARHR